MDCHQAQERTILILVFAGSMYSDRVFAIVKGTVIAAAMVLAIPPQKKASVAVSSVFLSSVKNQMPLIKIQANLHS